MLPHLEQYQTMIELHTMTMLLILVPAQVYPESLNNFQKQYELKCFSFKFFSKILVDSFNIINPKDLASHSSIFPQYQHQQQLAQLSF